jgi:hypothetical protein
MLLSKYIGKNLKSDSVIKMLQRFDMSVIYHFDRLHENTPDSYSAAARRAGFEIRFNDEQILDVIWCYVEPRDGFCAVEKEVIGAPLILNFSSAKSYADESGAQISQSNDQTSWFCLKYENLWIHYEFSSGKLALMTFMLK